MGYNIYYMYDIAKGTGYIGQNTDANDDKRIIDHYKASIKPKTKTVKGKEKQVYDGGAVLIKDAARLSDIRYKFFNDPGYGIPINIYNLFLQEGSLDPTGKPQQGDDLTNEEKLDLAEIMHNLAAHLHGEPWNKYNRLLGGMSYTKDNQTAMKSLTYRFTDEGINALKEFYKKIGEPNKKIEYTVTRFQAQKTLTEDDFSKIIYPLRYLTGKAFVQKVILEMLQDGFNNFFKSLLKESRKETSRYQKFRQILIGELGSAVAETGLIPDEWSKLFSDMSGLHSKVVIKNSSLSKKTNREFADFIFEQFDKLVLKREIDNLHNDINFAIRKMIRGTDANWTGQLSREQVRTMISKFFGKLKKMSLKSMSELFTMKSNNLHVDISEDITIPHQFLVNIEEKYTTLPEGALQLKRTQLLSQGSSPNSGFVKIEICKDVCLNLFSQIQDLVPSQYDTSQTLQSRLYDTLHQDDGIRSGYSWDFCRTLIEIGHEYTYGSDAGTRKIDTSFYNENLPAYEKYRFARTDIIKAAEEAKEKGGHFTIHGYRGTFYDSSGVSKNNLDSAAKVLADKGKG